MPYSKEELQQPLINNHFEDYGTSHSSSFISNSKKTTTNEVTIPKRNYINSIKSLGMSITAILGILMLFMYNPDWFMNWIHQSNMLLLLIFVFQFIKLIFCYQSHYSSSIAAFRVKKWMLRYFGYSILILWIFNMIGAIDNYESISVRISVNVLRPLARGVLRPSFTKMSPYNTSYYYGSTESLKALWLLRSQVVERKEERQLSFASNSERRSVSQSRKRLAIVKVFYTPEKVCNTNILDSFYNWESFRTCQKKDSKKKGTVVDLFLSVATHEDYPSNYSSLSKKTRDEMIESIDKMISYFWKLKKNGGWASCFDNIYIIHRNIPFYHPNYCYLHSPWGQNELFVKNYETIKSGEWGGQYDLMYYFERDLTIRKDYWLDTLLNEVMSKTPFAVLGSEFLGDRNDPFYEQNHYSGLHELSGNAVYNLSSPLLHHLVDQIKSETNRYTSNILVPYNKRMFQILLQGQYGIVPKEIVRERVADWNKTITQEFNNNTAMFRQWWKMYGAQTPFKTTEIIADYANEMLLPHHFGEESVYHGGSILDYYNSSTWGNISLVISQKEGLDYSDALRSITLMKKNAKNLFSQMVFMTDKEDSTNTSTINDDGFIRKQHRTKPAYMDLCEANVQTEWFMIADTSYRLKKENHLMIQPKEKRTWYETKNSKERLDKKPKYHPLVSYISPYEMYEEKEEIIQKEKIVIQSLIGITPGNLCSRSQHCIDNNIIAYMFTDRIPDRSFVDLFFANSDMVFHTKTRDEYCAKWKGMFGETGENITQYLSKHYEPHYYNGTVRGPTAMSYYTYLFSKGVPEDFVYTMTNYDQGNQRGVFKKRKPNNITSPPCICYYLNTKVSCTNTKGCVWRPRFGSCHAIGMNATSLEEVMRTTRQDSNFMEYHGNLPNFYMEQFFLIRNILCGDDILGIQDS